MDFNVFRLAFDYLDDSVGRDLNIDDNIGLSCGLNDSFFDISAGWITRICDANWHNVIFIVKNWCHNSSVGCDDLNFIIGNFHQSFFSLSDFSNCLRAAVCILNNVSGLLIGLRILSDHNFGILFTKILNHDWLNYHIVDEDNLFACLLISDHLNNSVGLTSIINIVDVFIVGVCCLDNNWLSCGNINYIDWSVANIISW